MAGCYTRFRLWFRDSDVIHNKYSSKIDLRRLDAANNSTELSLNIEFNNFESIIKAKNDLKTVGDIQFSFIENY